MSRLGKRVNVPGCRREAMRRPIFEVGSAVSIRGPGRSSSKILGPRALIRGHHLPAIGKRVLIGLMGSMCLGPSSGLSSESAELPSMNRQPPGSKPSALSG